MLHTADCKMIAQAEAFQSQCMWKNRKMKFVMKMCISTFARRLPQLENVRYLVNNADIWYSAMGKCKLPNSGPITSSKEQQTQSQLFEECKLNLRRGIATS